jgi:predicted ester cyclase
MGVEENRKNARRLDESFNQRDWDSFRDCFADNAIHHNVPEELGLGQGPDAVLTMARMQVAAFPDVRTERLESVFEGDTGAFRYRETGTHEGEFMGIAASGHRVDVETAAFARYNHEGKLVEARVYQDNLAFMQQIGAIPGNSSS